VRFDVPEKQLIVEVMKSVIKRTRAYFKSEFDINVTENNNVIGNMDEITLLDLTALIKIRGAINLLVIFSFEASLINAIYYLMTLDLGIEASEVEKYRKAAAGEVINIVLGHSTIDLQQFDVNGIKITPPTILNNTNTIREIKYTMFYAQHLETSLGNMTISLVGSEKLFNTTFCLME
jgi:CheY-specific phosphatase CheX